MENKEKILREKLKRAINRVFDLFCEYEAQFGDYTQKEKEISKSIEENFKAKTQTKKDEDKSKLKKEKPKKNA